MKRIKKFLVSIFLSGVCLASSAPVFAGNKQSSRTKNTEIMDVAAYIVDMLDTIDKKMSFRPAVTILNQLGSVLKLLQANESNLSYNDKRLIFNWYKYILNRLVLPLESEEREMRDSLLIQLMWPTPRLAPVKYTGRCITEVDWNSIDGEVKPKA